jgi:hypothetical protein
MNNPNSPTKSAPSIDLGPEITMRKLDSLTKQYFIWHSNEIFISVVAGAAISLFMGFIITINNGYDLLYAIYSLVVFIYYVQVLNKIVPIRLKIEKNTTQTFDTAIDIFFNNSIESYWNNNNDFADRVGYYKMVINYFYYFVGITVITFIIAIMSYYKTDDNIKFKEKMIVDINTIQTDIKGLTTRISDIQLKHYNALTSLDKSDKNQSAMISTLLQTMQNIELKLIAQSQPINTPSSVINDNIGK